MRLIRSAVAGIALLVSVPLASGEVIMSNLSAADDAGGTLFGPGSTTLFKAYGWTMPASPYFLDDVTLRLAAYNTDEARVSIWSGATVPETELIELDGPVGPGADYHNVSFTPSSSFTLLADTTYWVYVEARDGGGDGFLWGDTTPATPPSGVGTDVGFVFNGNPSSFLNVVEINGTLVPEPGALALLAVGGLLLRRR